MPPKKKKDGKKKKKKPAPDGQTLEEKYQLTLHKIDSLQDHLVMHSEIARRSQAKSAFLREQVQLANTSIDEEKLNKQEITTDLIRQYKSMQSELTNRIYDLETKVTVLQEKLLYTEKELKSSQKAKEGVIKEKNAIIADLEFKIENMENAYENVLHDAFDMMSERLEKAKLSWKAEAVEIEETNKKLLLEFGLNPLDI